MSSARRSASPRPPDAECVIPEDSTATGGWPVESLGGRHSAVQGWVYDHGDSGRGSSWTGLTRPEEGTPENVWSTGTWGYPRPLMLRRWRR